MRRFELLAINTRQLKMSAFRKFGVTLVYNATREWHRAGSPINATEIEKFAHAIMISKGFYQLENVGIFIKVVEGNQNTGKHWYEYKRIKRKTRRKTKRAIEIRAFKDDRLLATAYNKKDAIAIAKAILRDECEDVYGRTIFVCPDIDFTLKYNTENTIQRGQYIIFASDQDDVVGVT